MLSSPLASERTIPRLADGDYRPEPAVVARLSDRHIAELPRPALIALIDALHHLWTSDSLSSRLPYADDATLRRLAFLSRQCCRARHGGGDVACARRERHEREPMTVA